MATDLLNNMLVTGNRLCLLERVQLVLALLLQALVAALTTREEGRKWLVSTLAARPDNPPVPSYIVSDFGGNPKKGGRTGLGSADTSPTVGTSVQSVISSLVGVIGIVEISGHRVLVASVPVVVVVQNKACESAIRL
jgi:hypothetical protein